MNSNSAFFPPSTSMYKKIVFYVLAFNHEKTITYSIVYATKNITLMLVVWLNTQHALEKMMTTFGSKCRRPPVKSRTLTNL